MPQKKYIVRLSAEEREVCQQTVRKLKGSGEKVRRAQILLKADADGPGWTDERIADAFSCRTKTVENVRQRCVLEGFERALERKRRASPPVPKLLGGEQEAQIIALRLGPAPEGFRELVVAAVGAPGRRAGDRRFDQPRNHPAYAEKNAMTQRKIEYWVLPPQADAEFVAHMEQVLDLYQKPYDPDCPGMMGWTPPLNGIGMCQGGAVATHHLEEEASYGARYHHRHRSGEAEFSVARRS